MPGFPQPPRLSASLPLEINLARDSNLLLYLPQVKPSYASGKNVPETPACVVDLQFLKRSRHNMSLWNSMKVWLVRQPIGYEDREINCGGWERRCGCALWQPYAITTQKGKINKQPVLLFSGILGASFFSFICLTREWSSRIFLGDVIWRLLNKVWQVPDEVKPWDRDDGEIWSIWLISRTINPRARILMLHHWSACFMLLVTQSYLPTEVRIITFAKRKLGYSLKCEILNSLQRLSGWISMVGLWWFWWLYIYYFAGIANLLHVII